MTVDEFLDWASGTPGKWQLVDGEPRAMAPAGATHGIIQAHFAYALTRHLIDGRSPCVVVTEPAVVPQIRAHSNLRVPDLAVTCTPVEAGQLPVPEPVLLVEILSPSNRSETWINVWAYTTIPSVKEILVIDSVRVHAELLRRDAQGNWPERALVIEDGMVELESIAFRAPLAAIYRRTRLASGLPRGGSA
jgi:Uma2 family endonuclease